MANWNGLQLTNKGIALQAKVQAGTELEITKLKLGSGVVPSGTDIKTLTDLITPEQNLGIGGKEAVDDYCKISSTISNTGLEAGYYVRELGVFAQDPDDGEILYMYTTDGAPDYLPAGGGSTVISQEFSVMIAVDDTDNIVVDIDPAALATMGYVQLQIQEHNTDTTAHADFTGATAKAAGKRGMVPAPAAGDQNKALLGDGTWELLVKAIAEASGTITITKSDGSTATIKQILKAIQDGNGNNIVNTYATKTDLNAKAPLASNAGAHNGIFRGKNLGSSLTEAQSAAIQAGTFDDLFIGDYWTIGGVDYVIVAFDYYYNTCDTACTTHHAVIVPRAPLYNAQMNTTDVVTGAYVGSAMYTTNLNNAKTTIQNAFGSTHLLTIRQLFQNSVAEGGYENSVGEWYDATVWLMNEFNVYGGLIWKNAYAATNWRGNYTIDNSQYPGFALDPTMIHTPSRNAYWLRDVADPTAFAGAGGYGDCSPGDASVSRGVRPAFCIK